MSRISFPELGPPVTPVPTDENVMADLDAVRSGRPRYVQLVAAGLGASLDGSW